MQKLTILGLLLHFCMLTSKQKPQPQLMDHRRVGREKNVLASSYIFERPPTRKPI